MITAVLNAPWSLLALCAAVISLPYKIQLHRRPFVVIVFVRSFWWKRARGVRAATAGSIMLLGPNLEPGGLEHELIHIEQYYREPFVHPFLYIIQSMKYGYRNNKYEAEAYGRAGNIYKGEV